MKFINGSKECPIDIDYPELNFVSVECSCWTAVLSEHGELHGHALKRNWESYTTNMSKVSITIKTLNFLNKHCNI